MNTSAIIRIDFSIEIQKDFQVSRAVLILNSRASIRVLYFLNLPCAAKYKH